MVKTGKIFKALVVEIVLIHQLPVEVDGFIGSKYHRGTKLQHSIVCKGFDNDLSANAVNITDSDTNYRFVRMGGATHACLRIQCANIRIIAASS